MTCQKTAIHLEVDRERSEREGEAGAYTEWEGLTFPFLHGSHHFTYGCFENPRAAPTRLYPF